MDDVRRTHMIGIVRELAARDPFFAWYPGSPSTCQFCGVSRKEDVNDPPEHHSPDCLWLRAVASARESP